MKNYIFETTATMKEYNNNKWWIDRGIIRTIRVTAENITEALRQYREKVEEFGITISKNALKTKNPMYVDTVDGVKQTGYVITGQMDFNDNYYRWVKQYIDLWVTIITVVDTEF